MNFHLSPGWNFRETKSRGECPPKSATCRNPGRLKLLLTVEDSGRNLFARAVQSAIDRVDELSLLLFLKRSRVNASEVNDNFNGLGSVVSLIFPYL